MNRLLKYLVYQILAVSVLLGVGAVVVHADDTEEKEKGSDATSEEVKDAEAVFQPDYATWESIDGLTTWSEQLAKTAPVKGSTFAIQRGSLPYYAAPLPGEFPFMGDFRETIDGEPKTTQMEISREQFVQFLESASKATSSVISPFDRLLFMGQLSVLADQSDVVNPDSVAAEKERLFPEKESAAAQRLDALLDEERIKSGVQGEVEVHGSHYLVDEIEASLREATSEGASFTLCVRIWVALKGLLSIDLEGMSAPVEGQTIEEWIAEQQGAIEFLLRRYLFFDGKGLPIANEEVIKSLESKFGESGEMSRSWAYLEGGEKEGLDALHAKLRSEASDLEQEGIPASWEQWRTEDEEGKFFNYTLVVSVGGEERSFSLPAGKTPSSVKKILSNTKGKGDSEEKAKEDDKKDEGKEGKKEPSTTDVKSDGLPKGSEELVAEYEKLKAEVDRLSAENENLKKSQETKSSQLENLKKATENQTAGFTDTVNRIKKIAAIAIGGLFLIVLILSFLLLAGPGSKKKGKPSSDPIFGDEPKPSQVSHHVETTEDIEREAQENARKNAGAGVVSPPKRSSGSDRALADEIEGLKGEKKEYIAAIKQLKDENGKLTSQVEQLSNKQELKARESKAVQRLQSQISQLEQEKIQARQDGAKEKDEEWRAFSQSKEEEWAANLRAQVEAAKQEGQKAARESFATTEDYLNGEVSRLTTELDTANNQIQEAETLSTNLNAKVSELGRLKTEAETARQRAEDETRNALQQTEEAKSNLGSLKSDVAMVQAFLDGSAGDVGGLKNEECQVLLEKSKKIREQISRVVPPSFRAGGDLSQFSQFIADYSQNAPAETAALEADLHVYAAALSSLEAGSKAGDRDAVKAAEGKVSLALHDLGESLYRYLKALGYDPNRIYGVAEKWAAACNKEVGKISGNLRIRLPGPGELAEATWMRFDGGQRISAVENWAIFDGDRVVRYAYVSAA